MAEMLGVLAIIGVLSVGAIDNACRVFKKDNNNYSILFVFWDAE